MQQLRYSQAAAEGIMETGSSQINLVKRANLQSTPQQTRVSPLFSSGFKAVSVAHSKHQSNPKKKNILNMQPSQEVSCVNQCKACPILTSHFHLLCTICNFFYNLRALFFPFSPEILDFQTSTHILPSHLCPHMCLSVSRDTMHLIC